MALKNFKTKYGVQVANNTNASAPSGGISGYDLLPIGAIMHWAGQSGSIPNGWLACDGSALSRSTYANLNAHFSAVSYPYGSGDGSTTFNVPDARGRSLQYSSSLAASSGAETKTLTDSEIKSHSHTLSTHSHPMSAHTHPGAPHSHSVPAGHTHTVPHSHTTGPGGLHTHQAAFSSSFAATSTGQRLSPSPTALTGSDSTLHSAHTITPTTLSPAGIAVVGLVITPTPQTSAATGGTSGDSSTVSTAYNGTNPKSSFSLMQPFLVVNTIIKAF